MDKLHLGEYRHFSSSECTYHLLYDSAIFEPRTHLSFGGLKEEKFSSISYRYPESGIYEISNGYCIAGRERVYMRNKRLFGRLQSDKTKGLNSLRWLNTKSFSRFDGTLLHLSLNGLENNYYHFIVEYFARLFLFIRSGLKADYYLIPNSLSFHKELHEIIGIESDRILTVEAGQVVTANKILVPTYINNYVSYVASGFRRYDKMWLPHWLRDAYLLVAKKFEITDKPTYIYISRAKASYRKVLNEEEVINVLSRNGFKPVLLEEISLEAQIRLFMSAIRIVAPHGAGLVNMSWCTKRAHILEIYPSRYSDPSFRLQADLLGHCYSFIRSEYAGDYSADPQFMNLVVDINLLREWIVACDNYCMI